MPTHRGVRRPFPRLHSGRRPADSQRPGVLLGSVPAEEQVTFARRERETGELGVEPSRLDSAGDTTGLDHVKGMALRLLRGNSRSSGGVTSKKLVQTAVAGPAVRRTGSDRTSDTGRLA